MATLGQFAQHMQRYASNIKSNATKIQRLTAIAVLSTVVMATPVGNATLWHEPKPRPGYVGGRARGNWQVGLGGAKTQTLAVVDASGGSTINAGKSSIGASQPGQEIHLTNNLPYIVPLDQGHSLQAPAGFVKTAVLQGVQAARNSTLLTDAPSK